MHCGLFEFYRPPETIGSLNCHYLGGFTFVNSAKCLRGPVCSCSPLQQWTQMFSLVQSLVQWGGRTRFDSELSDLGDGLTWSRGPWAYGWGPVLGGQAPAEGPSWSQTSPQESVQSGLYGHPSRGSLQGAILLTRILSSAFPRLWSPHWTNAEVHSQPAGLHFPMP